MFKSGDKVVVLDDFREYHINHNKSGAGKVIKAGTGSSSIKFDLCNRDDCTKRTYCKTLSHEMIVADNTKTEEYKKNADALNKWFGDE